MPYYILKCYLLLKLVANAVSNPVPIIGFV